MDSGDSHPPQHPRIRQSGETLAGSHVGDRRLRVTRRPVSQNITLPVIAARRQPKNPALVFVYGFAVVIVAGTLLLMLPFASASGESTPFLVALFTATSAVCVTGLVVVDTGTYWSFAGQFVIVGLIQVGGFGFMTSSTLLLLLIGRRATLRERMLLKEALGSGGLGSVRKLAQRVILFTLVMEAAGATFLTLRFLTELDPPRALWHGIFHAVSAFNNAGFDIVGGYRSLTPYNDDPVLVLTIAILVIIGGISYTVVEDLIRTRRFTRLTLDTKLVLITTAGLLVLGMLGLLFTERSNPDTLGPMDLGPRLLNAFYSAVTPRTAGFNTIDTGKLTEAGLLVTISLMFVGGAAGSTAGGIKVQTFSILYFAIVSAVRGFHEVEAFRRQVPLADVMRAIAVALLSLALIFVVTFALTVSERFALLPILFEAFSAFGTVGLSTGITPDLSPVGRVILILTMFAGRLGPLTLVLALAARERRTVYHWPEEAIKIG
jgi:trk system potassium uptake protein TrkH